MILLLDRSTPPQKYVTRAGDAVTAAVLEDFFLFGGTVGDGFYVILTDSCEYAGLVELTEYRRAFVCTEKADPQETSAFLSGCTDALAYPGAASHIGLAPKYRAWSFAGRTSGGGGADVVPVEPGNAREVTELQQRAFGLTDEAARRRLEVLTSRLEMGRCRGFAAEENGRLVSCAVTDAERDGNALIEGVCTDKEYRRRGFAKSCLWALTDSLLCGGISPTVFTGLNDNIAFYTRCGYVSF
ncbi:MAG: GNAT family N-acetyltransferase [Clostridia bacterium]|nr:GNAT family N-acetyltransferase [Clostridia bacterium]